MQNSNITLLKTNQELSFTDLATEYFTAIKSDWSGQLLDFKFSYCLVHSLNRLIFFCKSDGENSYRPETGLGQFVEGLWEFTVVELFIGKSGSETYREFNLAPNGAWWACDFKKYRERTGNSLRNLNVQTFSKVGAADFWQCGLSIPLHGSELDSLTCNVTAIIGREEQIFLTANSAPDVEPDYHLQALRLPPKVAVL